MTTNRQSRNLLPSLAALVLLSCVSSAYAQEDAPLAEAMPEGAFGFVEVDGLDSLIDQIQKSPYWKKLDSPEWRGIKDNPQFKQASAVVKVIEAQLGMDLWTAGKKLLGGQIAVAMYPHAGQEQPDFIGIVRVKNADALKQVRTNLQPFLDLAGETIEVKKTDDGIEWISSENKAFLAIGETWVAASNNLDILKKSVGLITKPGGKKIATLAGEKSFQQMAKHLGDDHLVRLFVNTSAISKAMGKPLYPSKLDNALASLLFGGMAELIVKSPYAGVALDIGKNDFALTAGVAGGMDTVDDVYKVFLSDPSGSGTPAIPKIDNLIGGFAMHRDIAHWYQRRDELLQPAALPGFDQFETGIGNLLPGKDFGQDVLPLLGNELTFVAASQDFKHLDGKPGVQLPGFGVILDLSKPREGADMVQLFYQTLTAILNIQAGQQGRQPWVMASKAHNGVQVSYARYLEKPKGERLPIVFNFMPAAALVDGRYILTSSLGLCEQLVDALKKPAKQGRDNRNINFELYPEALADILADNQSFFVARSVQTGSDPKEEQARLSVLYEILRKIESVQLTTQVKSKTFGVRLEGSWK